MKPGRWSRRFYRLRVRAVAREQPTCGPSSTPSFISCAPAVTRLLPQEFPAWGTVYHYFRSWEAAGVWVQLHRTIYEQVRVAAGRAACPSVVIMDAQSVKTTERGGTRGFDAHKRVRGRKRHMLVDTLGLPIASRVEPADTSDRR